VTPEEAIEAAELIELEAKLRDRMVREHGAAEYERGHADGYVRAVADMKAVQHGIVRDAELETRRWGPGGREAFGSPRPGDYPGQSARAEAEAEAEAGL
jgi:hypothetical protein